ncbi:MAG: NAD(P)-binding protein, partial [Pseudomonadota bacterium]
MIAGGGIGGLAAAFVLARCGHQVTMLEQSAAYVKSHQDEVFGAVAAKANIDPAYLKWYYENYAEIP